MKTNNIRPLVTVITLFLLIAAPFARTADSANSHDVPALKIARLLITESIRDREPAGPATKVFSSDLEKVYCFVDVRDIIKDTFITFTWYYSEKAVAKIDLPVRKGTRWRTYSSKRLGGLKGDWRVEVKDSSGAPVGYVKFIVE